MTLHIYNSLFKKEEEFKSLSDTVGLYTCGPTVYNIAHIGNFRAYICADILKRTLLYLGYPVNHVMNLTDVDDKTIRDSQKAGISLLEFTEKYTELFKKDSSSLNILPPDIYAKATENISEMISLIQKLLDSGYAYKTEDGSVYFDVRKDTEYGKLSPVILSEHKENAQGRMHKDEYDKESADDFALWKAWSPEDGDVFWESSFGKGRPGWHIECSAMSMKHLGETFDIHTGGRDLIFPHHENEIAQSECATGKEFVRYWVHNEWVLVDSKKMAKSTGNFVTLETIQEKGFSPLSYRYLVLMNHYRTPLNFTWESLEGASVTIERLYDGFQDLGKEQGEASSSYIHAFKEALSADFDTPKALSLIWTLLKEDTNDSSKKATLLEMDKVLGLGLNTLDTQKIPEDVIILLQKREEARLQKDWTLSDSIRDEVHQKGYLVKDTEKGQIIRRKSF